MQVRWSNAALGDLARLHAFLAPVNPRAAKAVLERLKQAPRVLQTQPQMGKPLPEFNPREVRRLIVGDYELRYEVTPDTVIMLRCGTPVKIVRGALPEATSAGLSVRLAADPLAGIAQLGNEVGSVPRTVIGDVIADLLKVDFAAPGEAKPHRAASRS
jgi:plasmid stabilization system protein ParE